MSLRSFITETIYKYLNEQYSLDDSQDSIKSILIKRVPFLKEYNIFNHPRDSKRLEAQRTVFNKNIKIMMGNEIINFPQYNISSEVTYYQHEINEKIFHNFIIKNDFHATKPKNMDDPTFRAFLIANNNLSKELSYHKEIVIKNGENIQDSQLDKIINEMNGVLFKIEDFTKKHHISLF